MSVPSLDEMTAENISSMLRDTYTFKGDWLLRNAHALANKLERQAARIAELERWLEARDNELMERGEME